MEFPTTEYIIDDSSSCDEYFDQVAGVFIDWYLELITKNKAKGKF